MLGGMFGEILQCKKAEGSWLLGRAQKSRELGS